MLKRSTLPLAAALAAILAGFAPTCAAAAPAWNVTAEASPTTFLPNTTGVKETQPAFERNMVRVDIRNLGDAPISGSAVPIKVTMDLQLPGASIESAAQLERGNFVLHSNTNCVAPAGPCTFIFDGTLQPTELRTFALILNTGAATSGVNTVSVSGGEAAGALVAPRTIEQQLTVSPSHARFGLEPSSLLAEFVDASGGPETQAGAHPFNLSVAFSFDTAFAAGENINVPSEGVKDVAVELPPGVAANELALGQCLESELGEGRCPGTSQLGSLKITIAGGAEFGNWAIFNLKPNNGHTNELGISPVGFFGLPMPSSVRTGSDYGITSLTPDINNFFGSLVSVEAGVWGVPADSSHDAQRTRRGHDASGGFASPLPKTPFFTMPSECGEPLTFRVTVDSRQHPGRLDSSGAPDLSDPNWKVTSVTDPALTGCEQLQSFAPHVTVVPDTTFADTPAGTTVEVSVPQGEGLTSANTLATPTLQNTKVTLPQGMVINPGQANGLGACQTAEDGVGTTGPPSCPANSKVGTVEIETPLLPDKLEGSVYVLQSNPPHLQLLVAASADDVNVKLVGDVSLNEATGQLTSTFTGTPQLPFTHFRLVFSGGAQAALMTPPSCGVYSTSADFTPWSSPLTPDAVSADAFALNAGPGGTACQSPLPFAPSLIAGATTDQAGGFTDFSLLLQRADGEQRIAGLQFKTPKGLLGMLSHVPLCPAQQAAAGTCSGQSQIGHTVVGAGAGPAPFYVPQAGAPPAPIYLTGPYKGAPFGLSIVVPVVAGPFNLGTVVVRAAISVDSSTAQLTISTDALPQILAGIPTDLRQIDAVIDRPQFMFNPTNCSPQAFAGIAQSVDGTTAALSSRFQVGSCQALKFKPDFKVSTQGKTSKVNGASLDAKVIYPTAALGANQASSQSNIASAKVDLPKQLPSRLTTLQKACLATQFDSDPAGCPVASRIGVVKALTPVLPVALTGPVYFVSNGGEAFPSLVAVLQGYGVRVDLRATTYISRSGITSSTFSQVPDVPISSFELYLPEGRYSALAANGNLCKSKLTMPTTFTAQDGAVLHQSTPIAVTGCPKAKSAAKKKKQGVRASRGGKK